MSRANAIAIIGIACRFPGARDPRQFWTNLRAGIESITHLNDRELQLASVPGKLLSDPRYVKAAFVLEDHDCFDAGFFGYSPREAACMDPQHRLFLECSWHALEDTGIAPAQYPGAIGVYGGAGGHISSYCLAHADAYREHLGESAGLEHIATDKDFLTSRVSYKLNLRGPSVTVQTACSTSLVAVHLACQSLLAGECDVALAGAVSVRVPHRVGYLCADGGILSPDGHCRAFDARAQGTVFGSGIGIVVLKPLEAALADRDSIYAVIRGSAINNDGGDKLSYTASSVDGQVGAMTEALAVAGCEADSLSYVEAHGTATYLGDPLEVEALRRTFGDAQNRCAIGSVKTNIGHLEAAAGMAGLIKTALALKHRELPPTLHFERPNPRIDFAATPFHVATSLTKWTERECPRRAGVNALGIGGTNAFLVLEQAPQEAEAHVRGDRPLHPFRRERHWLPPAPAITASLLGSPRQSPTTGEISYEAKMSNASVPYLADHRLFGQIVVPGAAFLALPLTAQHQQGASPYRLADVEFTRLLALAQEESATLQLVLSPAAKRRQSFQVFTRPDNERGGWICRTTGTLRVEPHSVDDLPEPVDLETQRGHTQHHGRDLYDLFHQNGLELGNAFQAIARFWAGDTSMLAEITAPDVLIDTDRYLIHPVLLDACMQTAIGIHAFPVSAFWQLHVPLQIDQLIIHEAPGNRFFCHARLRTDQPANGETRTADLGLFTDTGRPLGHIKGLTLKRVTRQTVERIIGQSTSRTPRELHEAWLATAPKPEPTLQLQVARRGTLDGLTLATVEARAPGPDEVQIDVSACGLNFRDVLNALGMYPGDAGELGMECAGVVRSVGAKVQELRPGDEVLALAAGSMASRVTTDQRLVVRKPSALTFTEAAAIPVVFATAYQAFHELAQLRAGERVLIHAAAGGVGLAAVQLAQRCGAEIFATASRGKWPHLQACGVTALFNSRCLDFSEQIRDYTGGRGVDVILNSLAGEFIPRSLDVLAKGGRFVEIGKQGIWTAEQVRRQRPDVAYYVLALDTMMEREPERAGAILRRVIALFERGELQPSPCTVHPIEDAATAFRTMQQARHVGKIVLSVKGDTQACEAAIKANAASLLTGFRAQPSERRRAFVMDELNRRVACLLGLDPALSLDAEAPLLAMGLDSLMMVEFRHQLLTELGSAFTLAPTLLFDHPTIGALADHLAAKLGSGSTSAKKPLA